VMSESTNITNANSNSLKNTHFIQNSYPCPKNNTFSEKRNYFI